MHPSPRYFCSALLVFHGVYNRQLLMSHVDCYFCWAHYCRHRWQGISPVKQEAMLPRWLTWYFNFRIVFVRLYFITLTFNCLTVRLRDAKCVLTMPSTLPHLQSQPLMLRLMAEQKCLYYTIYNNYNIYITIIIINDKKNGIHR